jgi:hypothetical protein
MRNERIEQGHEVPDSRLSIDDFDNQRQIIGDINQAGSVEVMVQAKPLNAAKDHRAREPLALGKGDDRRVERLMVVPQRFMHENAQP